MIRQGKFFRKLFIGNVLLLFGVVGACLWLIFGAFDAFFRQELSDDLLTHAHMLRHQVQDDFDTPSRDRLDQLAKALARSAGRQIRITFLDARGMVLGDSSANPSEMEPHSDREEIRQAMQTGLGESTRWSATLNQEMKYVAIRVGTEEAPAGVVRVSMPVRSIAARTRSARFLFWRIALTVLMAAVILALGLARLWSRRIARVTATARSISKGDLSARVEVSGSDELALLARAVNRMRDRLAEQLQTIDRQRLTLQYLLAQLREGVIVVDRDGRIILVNPAATQLLNRPILNTTADSTLRPGSRDSDVLPPDLARMLDMSLEAPHGREGVEEARLSVEHDGKPVTLLARASEIVLPDEPHQAEDGPQPSPRHGRLLVLTDITELTRTIQVKTDFVANASHELRTPLSTIRAAMETLMTLDWAVEAKSARSLLDVINRHSDRLEALVEDLLDLSRLEASGATFEPSTLNMRAILEELRERFAERLERKRLRWEVTLDPAAESVLANRDLLVLVLANLIDNAIKFTDEAGRVAVSTNLVDGMFEVSVEDDGCGIPAREQERVFERFYQVERSRSGAARGTGLGLAIVRHAVHAMHGTISLDSTVGEGTRISIRIPQAPGIAA